MKSYTSVFLVLYVIAACSVGVDGTLRRGGLNVCQKTVPRTTEFYVKVNYVTTEYYSTCCGWSWPSCWKRCTRSRRVTRTKLERRTKTIYDVVQVCCAGYSQRNDQCPIPICNSGCLHGSCTAPNKCTCSAGWGGSDCSRDINECSTNNGGCEQECRNLNGGHVCACRQGYRVAQDVKKCIDVNECIVNPNICSCADQSNNPLCNVTCVNEPGTYNCACTKGYESVSKRFCTNIVECNTNNGDCSDYCYDTPGSYHCGCPSGYQLAVDAKTCEDIDECLTSNGGCEHNCNNTIGSLQCSCRTGFTLDGNGRTCSDKDECQTNAHGCQYCQNERGSFKCTCPKGYQLNSDKKTCSDINECEFKPPGESVAISGCSQSCNNTDGSFHCLCLNGYSLANDNKTCQDVDECFLKTDKCEHMCINVVGSYACACRDGYTISENRYSCVGEQCENLPPVVNGNASCLTGVTDEMCSFQCHPGFSLEGSSKRWCQSNHKWNGTNPICKRKTCPLWQPPINGAAVLPCHHFFESECKIKCAEGYILNGSDTRRCIATDVGEMMWMDSKATCEKSTACLPNPCFHSGVCSPNGEKFTCDCRNTGYKGILCRTGIITVPQIPIMGLNMPRHGLMLRAKPDKELTIEMISSSPNVTITPSNVTLTNSTMSASFSLLANVVGFFTVKFKLSGKNALNFVTPLPATIFVQGKDDGIRVSSPVYSDGSIKLGCYENEPEGTTKAYSNFKWNKDGSSNGVIQVTGKDGTRLPLSLSGGKLKPDDFTAFPFDKGIKKVGIVPPLTDKTCYSQNDASKYIGELLNSNAFMYSIQNAFNNHSPYWIKFVAALNVKEYKAEDLGGSLFKGEELVRKKTPCTQGLLLNKQNVYYHYQTKQIFYAVFVNKNVTLPMTVTKCFVKNLDTNSVYVAVLPDTANEASMEIFSTAFSKIMNTNGTIDRIGFTLNSSKDDEMHSFGKRFFNFGNDNINININLNGVMRWRSTNISKIFSKSDMRSFTVHNGKADFTFSWEVLKSQQSIRVKGDLTKMELSREDKAVSTCTNKTIQIQITSPSETYLSTKIDNVVTFNPKHNINANVNHETIGGNPSIASSDYAVLKQKLSDDAVLKATLAFLKAFKSTDNEVTTSTQALIPVIEALVSNSKFLSKTTILPTDAQNERISIIKSLYLNALKRYQILSNRYLKIDFFDDARMEEKFNTFKALVNEVMNLFEYDIIYSPTTSTINWFEISGVGDMCMQTYCFKDLNISVAHGTILSDNQCYSQPTASKDTIIKGMVINNTDVGGMIKLPTATVINMNLPASSDVSSSSFSGHVKVYEQPKVSQVKIQNTSLSFEIDINFLRQDKLKMNVTASLASIAEEDPINFNFKNKFHSPSSLVSDINQKVAQRLDIMDSRIKSREMFTLSYQNRTSRIANENAERFRNKTKSVMSLQSQLGALVNNISITEKVYQMKKRELNSSFAAHSLTKEQLEMKSKLLNDCRPKLCIPKCIPGITLNICQSKRFVGKVQENCTFVTKPRNRIIVVQRNETKSYTTFRKYKHCSRKCPPLTGFFKKLFGKRKKRGIVKAIAVPALTALFHKMGGTEGALGAFVGGVALGPAGAVIGGIIGSIFGSCDEACRLVLIPRTAYYESTTPEKRIKKEQYLESICKIDVRNSSNGFNPAEVCFQHNNCSNLSEDVRCINRNIECKRIQSNLSSVISSPSYDDAYRSFIKTSALLDLLKMKQSILTKRLRNARNALEISKGASLQANQSKELADKAKLDFNNLIKRERKLIAAHMKYRNNDSVLLVTDVKFRFAYIDGMKFPKRFVLDVEYKNLVSAATQFTTMFIAPEYFASIEDAARMLIKNAIQSIPNNRRKRRSISTPAVSQLQQKCLDIETSAVEIYDIAISLSEKIKQAESTHNRFVSDSKHGEREARSYTTKLQTSMSNAYECDATHCDEDIKQLMVDISVDIKNQNRESNTLSWNETLQQFFTNFEFKTNARENSKCVNFLDCVTYHLDKLDELTQYENTTLAKKVRDHLQIWNNTILTLFNDQPSFELAKTLSRGFMSTFREVNPRDIFCGEAPKIKTLLSGNINKKIGENFTLVIDVEETVHGYEIIWKKNNFVIGNEYAKQFMVKITDAKSAYYSCEVTNVFGSTYCGEVFVTVYTKPEITRQPEDVTAYIHSPEKRFVICNFTGFPEPTIEWVFRNFTSDEYEVLPTKRSPLLISTRLTENSGFYFCRVQNELFSVKSKEAVVNIISTTMAVERTKLYFTLNLIPATARTRRNINNDAELSTKLTSEEKLNIIHALAEAMDTTESSIRDLAYTKVANGSAEVSFVLYGKNLTGNLTRLNPGESWDSLANEMTEDRGHLLGRPILLYYNANNTMSFVIGGKNVSVNPESIEFEGMEVACKQGQVVLENGIVCADCPAGTRFDGVNQCTECEKGTYQPMPGQSTCRPCPAENMTTRSSKSVSVKQCLFPEAPTTPIAATTTTARIVPAADNAKDNDALKIIIPVVAVVILLIAAIIILYIYCRRKENVKEALDPKDGHANPTFETFNNVSDDALENPYDICGEKGATAVTATENDYDNPQKIKQEKANKRLSAVPNLYEVADGGIAFANPTFRDRSLKSNSSEYDHLGQRTGVVKPRNSSSHYEHAFFPLKRKPGDSVSDETTENNEQTPVYDNPDTSET